MNADTVVQEWAERCREEMIQTAMQRCRDLDEAEEMVQEALVTAVHIGRRDPTILEGVRNPCRWLTGITRNVDRERQKKEKRRKRIENENGDEIRETVYPEPDPGWDVDSLSEQVLDAAKQLLTPSQLKTARCMLQGMKDEEIAAELGRARSTVRWHRMSVVRILRKHALEGNGPTVSVVG